MLIVYWTGPCLFYDLRVFLPELHSLDPSSADKIGHDGPSDHLGSVYFLSFFLSWLSQTSIPVLVLVSPSLYEWFASGAVFYVFTLTVLLIFFFLQQYHPVSIFAFRNLSLTISFVNPSICLSKCNSRIVCSSVLSFS